jgi:hypothetical protein
MAFWQTTFQIKKERQMKCFILSVAGLCAVFLLHAQTYPEPEFSNEVYYLKKDSAYSVMRLEKGSSKIESKTKLGGMGGYESGYEMEGSKSTARLTSGNNLSFVVSKGTSATRASSPQADSMMRANGMDPSTVAGMMESMNDPSSTISLYKVENEKGKRKILMQKSGGAMPFASKKNKSSDKYTFSVKKIRAGYWELVIDKSLPRGEYAFTMINMGMGNADGSTLLFAFAVD